MNLCKLCKKDLPPEDDAPDVFSEITAWVHGPKKDGAVHRTYTGEKAHGDCVRAEMSGVTPGQASLFDV